MRGKGPAERFFRTLREDLLQALPGYKGPDVHSRGADPKGGAFFFLDELEAIICEWVAVVYHHRPHDGLADPGVPGLRISPAAMFEHGIARAGYVEVPRDPDLAYEFLKVEWRSIQHYGTEIGSRRYNGTVLDAYRNQRSPYPGGSWPFHLDPDDITRIYFRDPGDHAFRVQSACCPRSCCRVGAHTWRTSGSCSGSIRPPGRWSRPGQNSGRCRWTSRSERTGWGSMTGSRSSSIPASGSTAGW